MPDRRRTIEKRANLTTLVCHCHCHCHCHANRAPQGEAKEW
jgi:hypothetical protein